VAALTALTALAVAGCGQDVARDIPPASAPDPSVPPVSTSAPPTSGPVDRSSLVSVGPLPDGWTLVHDASPTIPGDPVRVLLFRGPATAAWSQGVQGMVVDAAFFPGLGTDGRAADLAALAQLGLGAADGHLSNRRDIVVQGRPAAAFDRTGGTAAGPGTGTDTVVVSTIGDWRVQVSGQAASPDTVLAFAGLVVVA
jgi:hypothetical protein